MAKLLSTLTLFLFIFLKSLIKCQVPLLLWDTVKNPNNLPSGHSIQLESAYEKYVKGNIDDKKVLLFIQDELSIDDFSKFSSSFKYMQSFNLDKKPFVLPSVIPGDKPIDKYLMKIKGGKVQHVYSEDINGWEFNNNFDLVMFHLEPVLGTSGNGKKSILKNNDELFHYAVKKVEKSNSQFSIIYTALEPSKMISQLLMNEETNEHESVGKRHLLATKDELVDGINDTVVNVTGGGRLFNRHGCVLLFATGIKVINKENKTEFLDAEWSVKGSACTDKEYSISLETSEKRGDISNLQIFLNIVINEQFKQWHCQNLTLSLTQDGKKYKESIPCGGHYNPEDQGWPFTQNVGIIVPQNMSYACNCVTFKSAQNISLQINGMQLEPNSKGDALNFKRFSNAFNCEGFFSIEILTGIFVTIILGGGLFLGILMMMAIQTPERFDDPKGPQISVNAQE